MAVQVKTLGPSKAIQPVQRFGKTKPTTRASSQVSHLAAKGAEYQGTASSPHIKPEYISQRLKSLANVTRSKSIKPDLTTFPAVKGEQIPPPPLQPVKPTRERPNKQQAPPPQKRERLKSQQARHKNQSGHFSGDLAKNRLIKDIIETSQEKSSNEYISPLERSSSQYAQVRKLGGRIVAPIKHVNILNKAAKSIKPHHIELNLLSSEKQAGLLYGSEAGGSGLIRENTTVVTQYEQETSPIPHALSKDSSFHQGKFKRRSVAKLGRGGGVRKSGGSHVQLTDYIASQQHREEIEPLITKAEGDVVKSPTQSAVIEDFNASSHQFNQSNASVKATRVSDYNHASSPQEALVPKLESTSIVQQKDGAVTRMQTTQFGFGSSAFDELQFANMVNSRILEKSLEDTQIIDQTTTVRGPDHTNASQPSQPTVENSQRNSFAKDSLMIVATKRPNGESGSPNARPQRSKPKNLLSNIQAITKYVQEVSHSNSPTRRQTYPQPSSPTLEHGDFSLVAQRKQVVINQRIAEAHLTRKRQATSKNEIKRQALLLQNLPMISSKGSKPKKVQIEANTSPMNINNQPDTAALPECTLGSPEVAPNMVRMDTTGLSTFHLKRSPGINQATSPDISTMGNKYEAHVTQLASRREDIGTAEGLPNDMFDSRLNSRDKPGSPRDESKQSPLNLTMVSGWEQQNIMIGSRHLNDQQLLGQQVRFNSQGMLGGMPTQTPLPGAYHTQHNRTKTSHAQHSVHYLSGGTVNMQHRARMNNSSYVPPLMEPGTESHEYQIPHGQMGPSMPLSQLSFHSPWTHGKASTVTDAAKRQVIERFRHAQSKSVSGRSSLGLATTSKSQQRQIRGLERLQDFQSTNVSNIKISRLNDLNQKDDGNPMAHFNKIKREMERRRSIPAGGLQTQILANYNREAKFQQEAIQDFTTKGSLYNRTQVVKTEATTRLPLKKLIGNQALLVADRLARQQDNSFKAKPGSQMQMISRNAYIQDSLTNHSKESIDRISQSVLNQLHLNEIKQGSSLSIKTKSITQNPFVSNVDPKSLRIDPQQVEASVGQTFAAEQQIQVTDQGNPVTTENLDVMTPVCTSIALKHKQDSTQKNKILNDIAYRSRQNRSSQYRSRTQNSMSEVSVPKRNSHNQDMKDMLQNYVSHDTEVNGEIVTKKSSGTAKSPPQADKKIYVQSQVKLHGAKRTSRFSITGNSRDNRIETSDDNNSSSALNPMGIQDPVTPTNEPRSSCQPTQRLEQRDEEDDGFATMDGALSSKQAITKHQVFSHIDPSPSVLPEIPNLDAAVTSAVPKKQGETMQGADNVKNITIRDMQQTQQPSRKDEKPQALIGVTQVRIQKSKSVLHSEGGYNHQVKGQSRQTQRTKVIKKTETNTIEKELDSQQTMIRHSIANESYDRGINSPTSKSSMAYQLTLGKQATTEMAENRSHPQIISHETAIKNLGQQIKQGVRHQVDDQGTLQKQTSSNRDQSNDVTYARYHSSGTTVGQGGSSPSNASKAQKQEYPSMLNLISKKTSVPSKQQFQPSNRSGEKSLQTGVQASEILEQLNVMNQLLAPQHNGYHQLGPKLFPTNHRITHKHRSKMSMTGTMPVTQITSFDEGGRGLNLNSRKGSVDKRFRSKRVSANFDESTAHANGSQHALTTHQGDDEDDEEMGYVGHQAFSGESRFQAPRLSRQVTRMKKRQYEQRQSHIKSVDNQHTMSIMSTKKSQQSQSPPPPTKSRQKVHSQSRRPSYLSDNQSQGSVAAEEPKTQVELRKIQTVEKDFPNSINIESLLGVPAKSAYQTLDELIGDFEPAKSKNDTIDSLNTDLDSKSERSGSRKRPRKGLMRMGSLAISQLYKDHFKYEFAKNELNKLLGEQDNADLQKGGANMEQRYFLKLSGIQIVNMDCQSGLLTDMYPITIPMSKMVNLFFLSRDQIQKVFAQSLCLRKEDGQLKLRLDQDLLRTNTYKVVPRAIRDDYFTAPLTVSIVETLDNERVIKEQFRVEIRMPRMEIVTTAQEANPRESVKELFKTTMSHYLTGGQMAELMQSFKLLDWVQFAKRLIRTHQFGLNQPQEDSDPTIDKMQRFDHKQDFALYRNQELLAYERQVAKNLQLSLLAQDTYTMQVEFFKPLYIKLKVDTADQPEQKKEEYEHLAGYLPETPVVKTKANTVARLLIPLTDLAFIAHTFGNKISHGEGGFLDCLYETVQVHVGTSKNICRLSLPRWKKLEELNVRHVSQQVFAEHRQANHLKQEHHKYLHKTGFGGVKQILSGGQSTSAIAKMAAKKGQNFEGQSGMSADLQTSLNGTKRAFHQTSKLVASQTVNTTAATQAADSLMLPQSRVKVKENTEANGKEKVNRILVNNAIQCRLAFSQVSKFIHVSEFQSASGHNQNLKNSAAATHYERVTLDDYIMSLPSAASDNQLF